MVTNRFGNGHFMHPMRRLRGFSFFLLVLGFWVGGGVLCHFRFPMWSNSVPIKFQDPLIIFLTCSPKFPICSLIRFQWHLSFYSLFGRGSTSMHISCKEGGWGRGGRGSMTKPSFILDREAYLGSYIGECPMFQKYW